MSLVMAFITLRGLLNNNVSAWQVSFSLSLSFLFYFILESEFLHSVGKT